MNHSRVRPAISNAFAAYEYVRNRHVSKRVDSVTWSLSMEGPLMTGASCQRAFRARRMNISDIPRISTISSSSGSQTEKMLLDDFPIQPWGTGISQDRHIFPVSNDCNDCVSSSSSAVSTSCVYSMCSPPIERKEVESAYLEGKEDGETCGGSRYSEIDFRSR